MGIIQTYKQFQTEEDCVAHLERVRWNGTPRCAYCGSRKVTPLPKEYRHRCNACGTTFSVTVGTLFHHTHLDLRKWFLAIALVLNTEKGLSARQLAKDIGVNKNTACRIALRIHRAIIEDPRLLEGVIAEMDECCIGSQSCAGSTYSKRGRDAKKVPVAILQQAVGVA
jgi:transposase-like protein